MSGDCFTGMTPARLAPACRCHSVGPGNGGVWHRVGGRRAEDDFVQALRMGDQIAGRELRASRVTVQAEPAGEVRDMLACHLLHQEVYVFVGLDAPASHFPVQGELLPTECGGHSYRLMRLGEGRPPPHGRPRVPDEFTIRPGLIWPGESMGQDEHPDRVAGDERRCGTRSRRGQLVLAMSCHLARTRPKGRAEPRNAGSRHAASMV